MAPSAVMHYATCFILRVVDAGIRTQWSLDEPESLLPALFWSVAGDPL